MQIEETLVQTEEQPVAPEIQEVVEKPEPKSVREELEASVKEIKQREPETKPVKAETKPVETPQPEKAVKAILPPQSWSAPAKAKFATLDPVLQNEILKREKEVTQGFSKLDEERALGKQIRDVAMPYEAIIRAEGGDIQAAFKDYLNSAYILRTASPQQKGQLLLKLAKQYGADLSQQNSVPVHPVLQQLQDQVASLQAEKERERNYQQQQMQTTIQQEIESFSSDPANIHFEEVKADMAALLKGGLAQTMQEAYDKAVWARPDIRSTLLQGQQAEQEAKRKEEAKQKADAARKAGSSLRGNPGAPAAAASPQNRTLREELVANLRAAQS